MSAWRAAAPSLLVREDAAARGAACSKIAGFDMNDTLVSSRIGAPGYQVTIADWRFYNPQVVAKLRELPGQGFRIVIFTNQGNIKSALDGKRAQAVKAYVDAMLKELGVPVLVLMATQRDHFRKPLPGMWEHLEQKANAGIPVDRAGSFYVGDAAGGPGEHSADDSNFAKGLGVRFVHTNEYFGAEGGDGGGGGGAASGSGGGRGGHGVPGGAPAAPGKLAASEERQVQWLVPPMCRPIVLVLVGAPGSGKTTFASGLGPPVESAGKRASGCGATADGKRPSGAGTAGHEASRWRRVCQDLLGNKEACMRAAQTSLRQGLSVVIDRTNYSVEQREPWLELAKASGALCHCLVFDVPPEECCRRVAHRPAHEGNLQGGGSAMVVMRLYKMLQPVSATEPFLRVRVVRTSEDVEAEVRLYSRGCVTPGEDEQPPPAKLARTAAPEPAGVPRPAPPSPAAAAAAAAAAAVAAALRAAATDAPVAAAAAATADGGGTPTAASAPRAERPGVAAPATSGGGVSGKEEDEKVALLAALGFSEEACRAALAGAGGDANIAANHLLAGA